MIVSYRAAFSLLIAGRSVCLMVHFSAFQGTPKSCKWPVLQVSYKLNSPSAFDLFYVVWMASAEEEELDKS